MDLLIAAGAGILLASGIGIWAFLRRCDKAEQELHELLKEEERKEKATLTAHLKEKVARQNAECALRSKRSLMESVSQEVLMLVSGISSFDQILALPDRELDDEEREFVARRIMENSSQLSDLVGLVLELSHYEKVREVDFCDRIGLNPFCQKIIEGYSDKVPDGVELHFSTSLPDDYVVHTNEECLVKVLSHLLDNAVSHTREGVVSLTVTDDGGREGISFTVKDSGDGIPKKLQKKVFEALPDTGYEQKKTGLILMVCRTLVRLLEGLIYIDPHYENGTSVVFSIKI